MGASQRGSHLLDCLLKDLTKAHFCDITGTFGLLHSVLIDQHLKSVEVDNFYHLREAAVFWDCFRKQRLECVHLKVFKAVSLLVCVTLHISKVSQ